MITDATFIAILSETESPVGVVEYKQGSMTIERMQKVKPTQRTIQQEAYTRSEQTSPRNIGKEHFEKSKQAQMYCCSFRFTGTVPGTSMKRRFKTENGAENCTLQGAMG